MAEDKKYKILIVPSSDDEEHFEECTDWTIALEIDKENEPNLCTNIHEFNTLEQLDAFVEGYQAGIGYLGEGQYFVSDNVVTDRCERNMNKYFKYELRIHYDGFQSTEIDVSSVPEAGIIEDAVRDIAKGWINDAGYSIGDNSYEFNTCHIVNVVDFKEITKEDYDAFLRVKRL